MDIQRKPTHTHAGDKIYVTQTLMDAELRPSRVQTGSERHFD